LFVEAIFNSNLKICLNIVPCLMSVWWLGMNILNHSTNRQAGMNKGWWVR